MDDATQHGRRGPVLHGILHGRVVRQVHPLPCRDGAASPAADKIIGGKATADDLAKLEELCEMVKRPACAAWGSLRPTPC